MTLLDCATQVNSLLAIPTTIVFMSVAVILTFKTRFVQIRALHRFWKWLGAGAGERARLELGALERIDVPLRRAEVGARRLGDGKAVRVGLRATDEQQRKAEREPLHHGCASWRGSAWSASQTWRSSPG